MPDIARQLVVDEIMRRLGVDPDNPDTKAIYDSCATGQPVTPAGSTVVIGRPLSEAQLSIAVKHDFCRTCGIDLFTNPEVRVLERVDVDTVRIRCDCGGRMTVGVWLFK